MRLLRLVEAVELDHFLTDLRRHVGNDMFIEVGVVLFLGVPDLGDAEAIGVFEGDVKLEAVRYLYLLFI
jgi:hypothetical protein